VFLLMGVADSMGPLSGMVSGDPAMASLVPFSVFMAFAIFSVPGGVLAARMGKKRLLLLGLTICAAATAVPAFIAPGFAMLLTCIFLLGVGTAFLQVAGNPMIRDICALGGEDPQAHKEGAYSRRLAMAQGIKGVGSTASSYLVASAASMVLFAGMGWRGAFSVFFAMAALAFFAVAALGADKTAGQAAGQVAGGADAPSIANCFALLVQKRKHHAGMSSFAPAVLGVFLYVGAEVCMATFLMPALLKVGFDERSAATLGPSLFFGAITLGRLAGGAIKLSARVFFRISAFMGLAGLLALMAGLMAGLGVIAVAAVAVCALGFANVWPMLFAITIEEMPRRDSELSGLMCMAVGGGAVVPLAMGALGGGAAPLAFAVPMVCLAYLALLSAGKGAADCR
jgi:fucose permease